MNARLFSTLLLALALATGAAEAQFRGAARDYAAEMAVNAEVQADFYKRYPDLQDEQDVVASAARRLAVEAGRTPDDDATAALLARRARAILAERTPKEWQSKAVSLYPELGVAGSEFNMLFLRYFNEMKETSSQFMQEPSWPVLLARRCADELKTKASTPATAQSTSNAAAGTSAAAATLPGAPTVKRSAWWAASLSFLVLLAIVVQLARLLWKMRRAFAGSGEPLTLWQRAMGPAAWAYLAIALIGLSRTFMANADQTLFNRSGIALLVSLLAGVVAAVPVYGFSLVGMWWWRKRKSATLHSAEPIPAREPELSTSDRK